MRSARWTALSASALSAEGKENEKMAKFIPFRGIRPAEGLEAQTAALPYDVYSREEARAAVAGHPLSFLNIDRPETQFAPEQDMYAPEVYEKAASMLKERLNEGSFVQDEAACYYVYELTMNGRAQTGLVGCASVDDYLAGVVKKHENTRAEKEADRIRHVDTCGMQTGPIFLACRRNEALSAALARACAGEPLFDFVSDDGIRHRGWKIDSPEEVSAVEAAVASIAALYIADGHHRAASAARVGQMRREQNPGYTGDEAFNYFLSVLFPEDELMIMDYNRVVKDLGGHTEEEVLVFLRGVADVAPEAEPVSPRGKGEIGLYLPSGWYRLRLHEDLCCDDPVEGLDVSILQRCVLTPLFGIGDPREDPRIDFVGGIRGLGELERRVKEGAGAAFSMYPTSIRELFAVADAGLLMPPKSTWFEPKLRSGLFLHSLED